jgi:transporter family-2 protein
VSAGPTTEAATEYPDPGGRAGVHGHTGWALGIMVVSGALLAAQARVNGELQNRLGGGSAVAVLVALVSFSLGTMWVVAVLLASRRARDAVRRWSEYKEQLTWWFFLGGIGGAALVSVSAAAVPIIGVALLSVCTVAGQTAGSLVVDEVGLGPGGKRPITRSRLLGAVVAVAALLLSTVGRVHGDFSPGLVLAITIAGFLVAGQVAVNGRLAVATGEARIAACVSFLGGTLVLGVLTGIVAAADWLHPAAWPHEPWFYLGGIGGAIYILLGAATVARLGVLRLSLASVAGQLLGSVLLDVFAPTPGEGLTATTVAGVVLTFVAVVITATSRAPAQ